MGILSNLFSGSKKLNIEKRFKLLPWKWRGYFSTIYQVTEKNDSERFALKVLKSEVIEKAKKKFAGLKPPNELEILSSIDSPYCVRPVETGLTIDGSPYLLMKWLDGGTMEQLVEKQKLNLATRCSFAIDMARAVNDVHNSGYVHRNICLKNFLADRTTKKLQLVDFGYSLPNKPEFLARISREGTPLFMAPEVVRRKTCSHRIDIFSLGVSMYWLMSGQHPWGLEDNSSVSAMQFDSYPSIPIQTHLPDLSEKIARLIDGCLVANPENRTELRQLLRAFE
ncbi:MAG: serine/threonine-protein kinase [Pirellulaceae bacterium]